MEIPRESPDCAEGVVGLLNKSLYGTRDAAANFQAEVVNFMKGSGFAQSRYNPTLFDHPGRNIRVLVHGDDFIVLGTREQVLWLRSEIAKIWDVKMRLSRFIHFLLLLTQISP